VTVDTYRLRLLCSKCAKSVSDAVKKVDLRYKKVKSVAYFL